MSAPPRPPDAMNTNPEWTPIGTRPDGLRVYIATTTGPDGRVEAYGTARVTGAPSRWARFRRFLARFLPGQRPTGDRTYQATVPPDPLAPVLPPRTTGSSPASPAPMPDDTWAVNGGHFDGPVFAAPGERVVWQGHSVDSLRHALETTPLPFNFYEDGMLPQMIEEEAYEAAAVLRDFLSSSPA